MKRVETKRKTKLAMTLVELVVAMALTALFATACIMLVLPVERIYTRTTDVSRAQILADTIVDSLRTECANTYIDGKGAVWIGSIGNQELTELLQLCLKAATKPAKLSSGFLQMPTLLM